MKADVAVIAPKRGGAIASGGELFEAYFQLAGGSSVLFDAVFVAAEGEGIEALLREAAAVAWVHDAFAHCKVIGATKNAQGVLDAAGVTPDRNRPGRVPHRSIPRARMGA
jgi:catalase